MPDPEVYPSLERRSRLLFSSAYRLPVWGAVGKYNVDPPEPFKVTDIIQDVKEARGTEIGYQNVKNQLVAAVALELIATGPKRTYVRLDSQIWPGLLSLIDNWSKPPERQLDLFSADDYA